MVKTMKNNHKKIIILFWFGSCFKTLADIVFENVFFFLLLFFLLLFFLLLFSFFYLVKRSKSEIYTREEAGAVKQHGRF